MSRYDLIGGSELVGYADEDDWDEVDELLSGYDLIGAARAARRGGRRRSPPFRVPTSSRVRGPGDQLVRPTGVGSSYAQALQQAAAVKQAAAGVIAREQTIKPIAEGCMCGPRTTCDQARKTLSKFAVFV